MNKETIKPKNNSFSLNAESEIITPCRNIEKDTVMLHLMNFF